MAVEPICTCVVGVVVVAVVVFAAVLWLICLLIVCLWLFITHLRAFWCLPELERRQRTDQKGLTNGWGWRAKADDAPPDGRLGKQNKNQNKKKNTKTKKEGDQNAFRNVYYNGGMRGGEKEREGEGKRVAWACRCRWGALKWEWNFFHIINTSIDHDYRHDCLLESTGYYCLRSTPHALNLTLGVGWILT